MSIQDLGSIGEFIAAIATIATLVYLSQQIRLNTRAMKQTEERGVFDGASRWRQNLIQHSEVAELYRKGLLNPGSLDDVERLRFRMLLDELFYHWFFQSDTSLEEVNPPVIVATLETPGGSAYWEREKQRFPAVFVDYVEDIKTDRGARS
jgi:hypothetical protein